MMNYVIYPEQGIINISDAIKEKKGISSSNKKYTINEMPDAIRSINNNGSDENDEKTHVMNFNMFNDSGSDDCHSYSNNDDIYYYNSEVIFISEEHFREIVEYYSAGYRVEIVTPYPEIYDTWYKPTSRSYMSDICKFTVTDIFENLYAGYSDYGRCDGAAISIFCFHSMYENHWEDTTDEYPNQEYSPQISFILRYNIASYNRDYYYYH